MFDFLLGLSAIGCAIMDGLCVAEAARPADTTKSKEPKPEERYVPDYKTKRNYRIVKTKQQRLAEKYGKKHQGNERPKYETESPLDEWIVANGEFILHIVNTPGKHIIQNELLNEIDAEKMADVLCTIPTIQFADVVEDGIEVVSR